VRSKVNVGLTFFRAWWKPKTLADLGTEGLNMINAGADPFSGVLAAALFYLVHNTDALRKATEEVRYVKHPTSPSKLTLAAQHSLPLRKS
jgi:hypothetical protein